MARFSPTTTFAMPTRKTRSPEARIPVQEIPVQAAAKASKLTGHGKPTGALGVFGERRAPARRADFRTPPR